MSAVASPPRVGPLLREWRHRRRLSQLDLALDAGVSTRHLSFIETGRARPSAHMILHLAERLDVPLRERNSLLLSAGHAPVFSQHDLDAPELEPVREAIDAILAAHEPFPALAVDRHWGMVAANRAVAPLVAGADPALLAPPVNVLRLSLHPGGLAPRIANLGEWRAHLLGRLAREVAASGDPALAALHEELVALPGPSSPEPAPPPALAVPLRIHAGDAELVLLSTVTTFGTPTDVTLSELSVEAFLPADEQTARTLQTTI